MSNDPWPEVGPGRTKDRKGSGSKGSGPSRAQLTKQAWYDIMEPLSWGRSTVVTVDQQRFFATIKRIRDQIDPDGRKPERTDGMIIEGFKKFALAIRAGHVSIDNKPAFGVFTSRWATYVTSPTRAGEKGSGTKGKVVVVDRKGRDL